MGDDKKRLLIVGKNSFIGQAYCRHAQEKGYEFKALGSADCDFLDQAQVLKTFETLQGKGWTVIFLAVINKLVENSYDSFLKNLALVRNLIAGCRTGKVRNVIFFSSIDVFGCRPELPITEETKICPDTYYGLAKAVSEWILLESGELPAEIPVAVLRIPGVYGDGDETNSRIGQFRYKIRNGEEIQLTNSGKTKRDFVHTSDLARLLDTLATQTFHGRLNVATGKSHSMIEFVRQAESQLGLQAKVVFKKEKTSRDFDLVFDKQKLRKIFPAFSMAED